MMSEIQCLVLVVWVHLVLSQFLHLASSKVPFYMGNETERIPEQYIVVLKDGVNIDGAVDVLMEFNDEKDQILYKYRILNGFCLRLSENSLSKVLDSSMVKYVEQDQMAYANTLASWGLDRIDQHDLPPDNGNRNYIGDGTNAHIYILDTGVRYSHPDFTGRTGDGFDAFNNSPDIGTDCVSHGTHVAGTAAGSTYGIATNATIHDVRVLNCQGSGFWGIIIAGMDWVAGNRANPAVACMSIHGFVSRATNDALQSLVDSGVVVITIAGNSYTDACYFTPASAPAAITVGATDIEDTRADFSNFGKCVDIFAPGVNIPSANYRSDTEPLIYNGTSMAGPHVTGAAAILLGIDPTLTPQEVTDLLLRGAIRNKVKDAHLSPNRLLYIGVDNCMMRCGSIIDVSRDCQCDTECSSRGDCCENYTYLCWENAPTCSERCGDSADDMTYPCQCEEACFSRGDCCQDYVIQCKPSFPCDSTHDHTGTYYSPYYPDTYLNDQTCHTTLKIPPGRYISSHILLYFDDFNLEISANCNHDNLTIYDGDNDNSPALGTFCGTEIPNFVYSSGRGLTIVFRSDSRVTSTGYIFRVLFQEGIKETIVTSPGLIMSENFPSNYADNSFIVTKILAPPGEQIVLNFTHFDIEGEVFNFGLYCYDGLSIYDSDVPFKSKQIVRNACTDGVTNIATFSPLKSSGSTLYLLFTTDGSVTRPGYRATVTSVKPCNSVLTHPGEITSSNHPLVYYNNERCFTEIRASCGKQVVISFIDFEVQQPSTTGVCQDYLKIYDGDVPDETALIGAFCGTNAPQVRSIGTKLLLDFASDSSTSTRGYKADVNFLQAVTARLVGGRTPSQGRVEIEHNKYGKGSVCDNNWDIKDANVVCKMLGYGAAKDAPHRSYFGQEKGPVLLDDVQCSGSEFNIDQCRHSSWKPGTCSRQGGSAVCYQKGEVPLPVRLMGGDVPNAGRVELRIGDEWGTVCGNNWDITDARVVCLSLGYRGAEKVLGRGEVTPGISTSPIFFDDVQCDGDESGIEFCRHSGVGNHNCDHSLDVGVQCILRLI